MVRNYIIEVSGSQCSRLQKNKHRRREKKCKKGIDKCIKQAYDCIKKAKQCNGKEGGEEMRKDKLNPEAIPIEVDSDVLARTERMLQLQQPSTDPRGRIADEDYEAPQEP